MKKEKNLKEGTTNITMSYDTLMFMIEDIVDKTIAEVLVKVFNEESNEVDQNNTP